jgi:hypothetical protein
MSAALLGVFLASRISETIPVIALHPKMAAPHMSNRAIPDFCFGRSRGTGGGGAPAHCAPHL